MDRPLEKTHPHLSNASGNIIVGYPFSFTDDAQDANTKDEWANARTRTIAAQANHLASMLKSSRENLRAGSGASERSEATKATDNIRDDRKMNNQTGKHERHIFSSM